MAVKDCSVAAGNAIRVEQAPRPCGAIICHNDMPVFHVWPRSCNSTELCFDVTVTLSEVRLTFQPPDTQKLW